jgi:hypothetical protein
MTRNWCCSTKTLLPPTTKRTNTALLGMAIKYAGLRGKEVRVIGRNRSSFAEEERIQ